MLIRPFLPLLLAGLVLLSRADASGEQIIVSAATSLTEAFLEAGHEFERKNPEAKLLFNFGSSGTLLRQLERGAPVDVFAAADPKAMDRAEAGGLLAARTRRDLAGNRLVLVVAAASAALVSAVSDLRRAEVKRVAVGAPDSVPAGRYARQCLTSAGLWRDLEPKLVLGTNVRQVLDYVIRGEVEAGFVFETDVIAARGRAKVVWICRGHEPIRYPVAVAAASVHRNLAQRFVLFLSGPEGQAILRRHGFRPPSGAGTPGVLAGGRRSPPVRLN